jgi:hypothetical protein
MLFFRLGAIWSGEVRHPVFIARRCSKQGKKKIGGKDSIGRMMEGNRLPSWRRRRRLTRRATLSAMQLRRKARQLSRAGCWASGRSRPKRRSGTRVGATGRLGPKRTQIRRSSVGEGTRATVKEWACRAKSEEKGKFLFLFSFQILQSIFK